MFLDSPAAKAILDPDLADNISICFTGALRSMTRNEASSWARQVGITVKPNISLGLTYLVQANPNSRSSKTKKAEDYMVKIISESAFKNMVYKRQLVKQSLADKRA